jgi:uncharacterized Tic20 family protein
MTVMDENRTKEDQLVAGLAHGGVLVPTFGVLIPLIIWITQKDRSDFIKFQALQATIWQLLVFVAQILLMGCYMVTFFLMFPIGLLAEGEAFYVDPASGDAMAGGMMLLLFLLIVLFGVGGLIYLGFGIAGIVRSLQGKDFQYPFIGRWVKNRISADRQINEKGGNIETEDETPNEEKSHEN